jgi:hypothetical protein
MPIMDRNDPQSHLAGLIMRMQVELTYLQEIFPPSGGSREAGGGFEV